MIRPSVHTLLGPLEASYANHICGYPGCRGGCALMGFAGTWAGRFTINRLGLLNAGVVALTLQVSPWAGTAVKHAQRRAVIFQRNLGYCRWGKGNR